MRALRAALGPADGDAAWEAFLLDVIWETPMPDYLLYGEPYPALNGVVLTADEHRRLARLTTVFAGVFQKAADALARDGAALERMGFPWVAIELLAEEAARERGPLLLARFDFLLEHDGLWQVVEYNADTPSGLREAVVVERLIARHLRLGGEFAGTGERLARAVRGAFRAAMGPSPLLPIPRMGGPPLPPGERGAWGDHRRTPPRPPSVGLVTDAGYAEDLAQTVFLGRLLSSSATPVRDEGGRPAGDGPAPQTSGVAGALPPRYSRQLDVVVGDVDNVWSRRGRLCVMDRAVDALYRYYPFETLLGQQAFADLFAAVAAGRVRLLNGLRGLLAQNKGLMAWIWAHREDAGRFTREERRAIRDHLPATLWIDDPTVSGLDARGRSGLVLKQVFGREGEEVYVGDAISDADWDRCLAWGSYVVQRRVAAEPVTMAIRTSRGAEARPMWAAVGSFAAAGKWAGYYTRVGEPITTAHAKYVGTYVEKC